MSKSGIIYVVENPLMPDIVKIGKTGKNLEKRLKDLFSTGVPVAFRCVCAKKVDDMDFAEKKIHAAFNKDRVNPNREFFKIPAEDLLSLFELIPGEYVTPETNIFENKEDEVAFESASKYRARFNFNIIGLKSGDILTFKMDDSITCEVLTNTQVRYNDETHSLSSAGVLAINQLGYNWKSIAGPRNWLHNGVSVYDLRDRIENQE